MRIEVNHQSKLTTVWLSRGEWKIRRKMHIREGDPLLKTLTVSERYLWAMGTLAKRLGCS